MVGRDLEPPEARVSDGRGEALLDVRGLAALDRVRTCTFPRLLTTSSVPTTWSWTSAPEQESGRARAGARHVYAIEATPIGSEVLGERALQVCSMPASAC